MKTEAEYTEPQSANSMSDTAEIGFMRQCCSNDGQLAYLRTVRQ